MDASLNQELTRVGPGTPGGTLLRRYWFPIATVEALAAEPVKRVRLLGEDLVLFRADNGDIGLVDEMCSHRSASLGYGIPEQSGIRCPYHGWVFSAEGECLEQPNQFQDSPQFRKECAIKAYKAAVMGGLVFAYMGPAPAPALPKYDLFLQEEDDSRFRAIGSAMIPCNWLQIVENSLDPTHVEWLHGKIYNYHLERAGEEPTSILSGRHVRIGFDRFEHGLIKRRLREGQSEQHDDWTKGHPLVFPNLLKVGGEVWAQFQIRVPVDDETTLHFWYSWFELGPEHADIIREACRLPGAYEVQVKRADGSFSMDTIDAQDVMAWVTQGRITDRTRENLCQGDQGIVIFRNLLREQMAIAEAGQDPMNVFRGDARPAGLPLEKKDLGIGGHGGNPLATFLRTQARHSPRFRAAVRLLDAKLKLPERAIEEALA
jgi:5,5'-dehydrodivanillate O-demethylase